MTEKCININLDDNWVMEGLDFTQGQVRKAYEPDYKPKDPVKAKVPGIAQCALLEAGKIDDPIYEMNNEKILWVEDKEWWFFKDFTVPENIEGNNYQLVFEGITYRANVWLDGIAIGHQEGMFLRTYYDITRFVKPGSKHRLTLRIRTLENSSMDRPGGEVRRTMVSSQGVVAPFSYFWNWSPHLVPVGIWKSVWLKITGGVFLDNPFVRAKINWDGDTAACAEITTSVEMNSHFTGEQQVTLKGKISGVDFNCPELTFSKQVTLSPGAQEIPGVTVTLETPKLWWPNGLGEHPLYRMDIWVEDANGNLLDKIDTEFGVREIEMLHNTDDIWVQKVHGQTHRLFSIVGNPHPWTFCVNKKKVFVRGTNWLPVDNLFRFTEDRYRAVLDKVEDANLNMMRIWGGGVQETELFYRMCDRRGIMTWAETWFCCGSYPVMPHDLFIKCAINQIKCQRNHPSMVMWSGGNEFNPDEPENKELVDKIQKAHEENDPTRPFHRGSPYKGDRHGGLLMLPTRTSNKYNGDILVGHARLVLFRSEVAVTRSIPELESVKKFIGKKNIWPINKKVWEYHHACVLEQERDAKEYGGTADLEHWMMSGQLVHGQNHRHNLEFCRQYKYWSSGCMQWQINGSWPSFHREIIDWYGLPKPAFYAYKRAAQDYLVVADMDKYVFDANEMFSVEVHGVSDKQYDSGECTVKAVIYDNQMKKMKEQETKIHLITDASVKAFTFQWKVPADYLEKVFFLALEMRKGGEVIATNLYWVGTSAYSRPDKTMNIDGDGWKVQVSKKKDEAKWKDCFLPSYWAKPKKSPEDKETVFYTKDFTIPKNWAPAATELEFFCQGLEGNDEVFFNGKRIGKTEEEMTILIRPDDLIYTKNESDKKSKVMVAENVIKKGNRQNIRVCSDPFTTPNLIKRFYKIPMKSVKWGDKNNIEIRLTGKFASGISEQIFIRQASTPKQQKAVIDYNNKGGYLADMRNLKITGLDTLVKFPGAKPKIEL
ncbi:MAG: hypothetical protein A2297_06830, partial [Elusimicrobia bacterium RIFOXYB2_FULL_48_7]